jgi:hypothetical protein
LLFTAKINNCQIYITTFNSPQIAANTPTHMTTNKSKLADNKTKPTTTNVVEFLNTITPEQKHQDCIVLLQLIQVAIGEEPILWSNSIVCFGIKNTKTLPSVAKPTGCA